VQPGEDEQVIARPQPVERGAEIRPQDELGRRSALVTLPGGVGPVGQRRADPADRVHGERHLLILAARREAADPLPQVDRR